MKTRRSIELVPAMIDEVRACRNEYKQQFEGILQNHKKTISELPSRFIGKELESRKEKSKAKFDEECGKLKTIYMDRIISALDEVEKEAMNEVKSPFVQSTILNYLDKNIPVTETEFKILQNEYSGQYWTDRVLSQIATKNGITADQPADIDVILTTIRSIMAESNDYFNQWAGETDSVPMVRMLLHDKRLRTWESDMLHGVDAKLTVAQRAARAVSSIYEVGMASINRAIAANNIMRNAESEPDLLALIQYGIATDPVLYSASIIPFLNQDFAENIKRYHDGKLSKPVPEEEKKPSEMEEAYQETGRRLSFIKAQTELDQMAQDAKARRMQAAEQKLAERQTAQQTAPATE